MLRRGLPLAAPTLAAALAAQLCSARPSAAQDLFSPDAVHGLIELRAATASGERSWTDGGFGKTPVSGHHATAEVSQAVLEWRPRFSFAASAVVSGQYQADGVHPRFDLDEAYLKLRSPPSPLGRVSARAGLFYPPVSLEHDGVGWTSTDLLSASAVNSWIGEEVKVGAVEVSLERQFGDHQVSATGAVFGWNDTSGTLLSFRGWALGDTRAGPGAHFRLPPLSAFMRLRQAPITSPMWEIDHRAGYYARLEWRPPAPVTVDLFHYDNHGDRVGVRAVQWAWQTRFDDLGVTWRPGRGLRVRGQALAGRTWMGFATPQTWVDVSFRAAYLMATKDIGSGDQPMAASLRLDAFDVRDHTWQAIDDNAEHGWAATAGLRRPLTGWADLFVEAQRVQSTRPSRMLANEAPRQTQTVLQTAVRLHF